LGSYLTTVFLIAHDSLASAMPERIVSQQHHSVAVVSYRTGISARSGSQSRTRILLGGVNEPELNLASSTSSKFRLREMC